LSREVGFAPDFFAPDFDADPDFVADLRGVRLTDVALAFGFDEAAVRMESDFAFTVMVAPG
jgi:hypothetical protein